MKMRYKLQLAALLASEVAALALVLAVSYVPNVGRIRDLHAKLAAFSDRQAELCKLVEDNPNADADLALARAELRRLETVIPPESRLNWLSGQIANLLRTHHIDLRAADEWQDAGGETPAPELRRLRRNVTLRAGTADIEAFLESIARLPFVVVIEDLQLTRDTAGAGVCATVRLATFVLRAAGSAQNGTPQA